MCGPRVSIDKGERPLGLVGERESALSRPVPGPLAAIMLGDQQIEIGTQRLAERPPFPCIGA